MDTATFGPAYDPIIDGHRINQQHQIIRDYMLHRGTMDCWHTLQEISKHLDFPEASVSAQLRHLRKECFGGYLVNKRRRGSAWEYQVLAPCNENGQYSLFSKQG